MVFWRDKGDFLLHSVCGLGRVEILAQNTLTRPFLIRGRMKEQKPFERAELRAMCMLSVAVAIITAEGLKLGDERRGRNTIEKEIENIVDSCWSSPNKKAL